MKIGTISNSYPEKRCIINKDEKTTYVDLHYLNVNRYLAKIVSILTGKFSNIQYQFKIPVSSKYIDALHFFNHISYANNNFFVTFETVVPRVAETLQPHHKRNIYYPRNKATIKGLNHLANNKCKQIIAISECAATIQKKMLDSYPEYKEQILKKMVVIHPPQKLLINDYSSKNLPMNKIRFLFIGRALHLKGGREIIEAFSRLPEKYKEKMELIIIGDLKFLDNHAFKNFQDDTKIVHTLQHIIDTNESIIHYSFLENSKVLELAKSSHIGLLPTWADTYGYSVLELQAAGCPVISTNIRALPEINNINCGWLIELPKNEAGELAIESKEEKDILRNTIQNQLFDIFISILNNPDSIRIKGESALQRIKTEHCPKKYAKKISEIYSIN